MSGSEPASSRCEHAGGHHIGRPGPGRHVRRLATLPLVFTAELGCAVAFGVLVDTIVVRAVLVTALNLDLGRRMW